MPKSQCLFYQNKIQKLQAPPKLKIAQPVTFIEHHFSHSKDYIEAEYTKRGPFKKEPPSVYLYIGNYSFTGALAKVATRKS